MGEICLVTVAIVTLVAQTVRVMDAVKTIQRRCLACLWASTAVIAAMWTTCLTESPR